MVEREKPPIRKTVTGFDYGIAGIAYFRGENEFTAPILIIPNKEWSRGIHLEDTPRFIISLDSDFVSEKTIDDKRTLQINDKGEVIAVVFQNSREGVILNDLPLPEELLAEAKNLLDAYHKDQNPDVEDYWRQKGL